MVYHKWYLLAVAGVLVGASAAQAQVHVRAPFVDVDAGNGGVSVHAPFVTVSVRRTQVYYPPAPTVVVPGQPVPVVTPPQVPVPPIVVAPQPPVIIAPRALTVKEFASGFQALPGRYEVDLIHPGSCCPVHVCFTLPPGCPRVLVSHRHLVFDYGHHERVDIHFALFGKVHVNYRH
jgi:hypothetical protein